MIDDILDSITGGEYDDSLDQIITAVHDRRQIITRRLRPGDEVRFSGEIRPKYLVGKTATVVKVNRQTVVVSCPDDSSYGRFCGKREVRCPNSLIEGLA